MRHICVSLAVLTALLAAPPARAQEPAAPPAWRLFASPEGCSISLLRDGVFVLLNVNPEGQQGLRIHHPDMDMPDREMRAVTLRVGETALAFEASGARTTDGTPGFIVGRRSDLRTAFGAGTLAEVEIAPARPLMLDLAGLPEALVEFDACAATLTPRDPETIVAVKPKMTRAPAIRAGDLTLEGATRREVTYRLTISPDAKIAACDIVRSSGSRVLDDQVCRLLRTGSRFTAGTNAAGKPVTATYQSRLTF
jgi:hypothetical protein